MPTDVSVIAAHADDEVLGCGGTIARLAAEGCRVHVLLLADGVTSRDRETASRGDEIAVRRKAAETACAIMGCASLDMQEFPDNRMDSVDLLDVVKQVERHIAAFRPATVFTHHAGDVNIDHRVIHDAVIAACRPQPGFPVRELLFFEVASSTEWRPPVSAEAFHPNWFVDITHTLKTKMEALEAYRQEMRDFPHPRSLQAMEALARWRGASVGMEAAEAFVLGRRLN